MSYSFDIASRVYAQEIEPHIPDETIAIRFRLLLEAMHDANHEVDDRISKNGHVHRQARELDTYLAARKEKP